MKFQVNSVNRKKSYYPPVLIRLINLNNNIKVYENVSLGLNVTLRTFNRSEDVRVLTVFVMGKYSRHSSFSIIFAMILRLVTLTFVSSHDGDQNSFL